MNALRAATIIAVTAVLFTFAVGFLAMRQWSSAADRAMTRADAAWEQVIDLRYRVVRDEYAFCRVLALTPDREQSRQIAALARRMRIRHIALDASHSARVDRIPDECTR